MSTFSVAFREINPKLRSLIEQTLENYIVENVMKRVESKSNCNLKCRARASSTTI